MATLDEVISQMSEEDYFSDSIQFIIDSDLRIVSIPDRGVVAGVVGDKNVNRINFQMPRYYNGFDMSKFTTKVNYINANSNMNYYAVTDLIVENDTILFTWLIDSDAVAYAGTVMFSVNMFIADSNGKITQAFNTSNKGKMTVLEGIQVDEYVTPEAQEDILTRLEADLTKCVNSGINQINTVTNESIQKIQVESTKATDSISAGLSKIATRTDESVKKVQDEGEKVKASIPTDYTELTETVSDLETQSSNLDYEVNSRLKQFYKYSKGATKINDSDNGRLHNLKVYGRSEQKQYSGKNLLNATLQTTTVNGVTCTNNGDGTYTLDGTANANAVFNLGSVTFTGDTKYKICGCPQGGGIIERYHIEPYGSTNEQRDIGNGVIYSLSNDETKAIYIVVTIGFRVNNLLFKPMITTDLTATYDDFEPYTGGIPSPNPDYPQEIKSVVNPTVKVCGKNLLEDGSLKSDNNGKIEYISAGKIKVTSSISAWYAAITNTLKLTPNTNYVLSAKCDSSNGNITCNSVSITGAYIKCAFLTDSDGLATIAIRCRYESAESRFVYSDLQLEKGSTATAYEPYTEQTVALPYTLNAIPVSSGGNVTIDGQQYIADYVDVERGKLVRMCKEYVITGSERLAMYWLGNASYLRNVCCINNFENIVLYDGINPLAMSDMFIGKISENADDERAIYLMLRGSGDKTLAIKFLDSDGITTVDLAKQWLIEHKPKTVFVLSTPEETDLTPEENEAFKALATYYPTTNIFANSEQLDGYTVFNYPTPFEDEWIKTKKDVDSLKEDVANLKNGKLVYPLDWIDGEYVTAETGEFEKYNGWERTGYIPIFQDAKVLYIDSQNVNSATNKYNAFYDENKKFIEYFRIINGNKVSIPSNSRYFAISHNKTSTVSIYSIVSMSESETDIKELASKINAVTNDCNTLKEDLEGFKGSSFTASKQYSENVLDNDNGVMEGWNAKVPVYLKKNIRYLIGVANSTALNPGVAINIIDESGSLLQVVKQDYTQIPTSNGVPFESTIDGKFYMLFKFIEGGITAWKKFMVIKAPQESVAWAEKDFVPFSYKKTYTANIAEKANQIQSRYYDKTHLSFGDSITEQAVWQSYFRKYLGTKMELIKGYSGQALWKNCSEQSLEEKLGNTQFDFATVMFGTNDWGQSRQIGSNSDTNDNGEYTGTFKGSLNTFFKNMTTKFPSKPFIMVTPPNGFEDLDYNNKPFSDNGRKNLLGLSIKDYADAIKELSAMWGIPCFDFNSVCGWNYINKSIYLKSEPNGTYIHPNGVGGQEYAYKLARFCEMN